MNGILVVNKPRGWTSHDVVNKTRRILQEKRIGHTGTLDPLATGVLVLCVGKATKIARYLGSDDKEYTAALKLGMTTDTQDADGRVLETREHRPPSRDDVLRTVESFRGLILQRPPAYSAVKVAGTPSYRLARKGTCPVHEERPVTIQEISILGYSYPAIRFSVRCSKGTYIRTLCADIGERLGMGAHLTELVRTRSGRFRLEQAVDMDKLADMISAGSIASVLISPSEALQEFLSITVENADAGRIAHGHPLSCPPTGPRTGLSGPLRVLGPDGQLLAVAQVRDGILRPEAVLV